MLDARYPPYPSPPPPCLFSFMNSQKNMVTSFLNTHLLKSHWHVVEEICADLGGVGGGVGLPCGKIDFFSNVIINLPRSPPPGKRTYLLDPPPFPPGTLFWICVWDFFFCHTSIIGIKRCVN